MLNRFYNSYTGSFKGLRKEVWWLAAVTLVNRAGTMVFPFLSLYMTADLGFTLKHVGWVLTAFGMGSVAGAWLGGKLSDKLGFYPIIFWSLTLSGIMLFVVQYIHSFNALFIAVFLTLTVSDMHRPAVYVAINTYSKPENRTRSVTLIRLAINLGFSLGPAVGGFIITIMGYGGLFWVDGITCIGAALFFIMLLGKKESQKDYKTTKKKNNVSPYRDLPYLLFILIVVLIGFSFLQYFSTIPLYYRDIHSLSEDKIGLLMAMNGLLIFLMEMPIIKHYDRPAYSIYKILFISTIMIACSFFIMNTTSWTGILVIGMLLMTFGEMLNFPFLNRFALDRSQKGKPGEYMALFTMSFSVSHIFGHNAGMQLVDKFGFNITWYIMTVILFIAAVLVFFLKRMLKNEKNSDR